MKKGGFLKATLLLISTLTVMSGATIAPSLPKMAEVFSNEPNAEFLSKLLLTLPALAIAIMAPIAGRLVDRIGRLKVLIPALALYAVAGSSGFFIHNLYLILVGRFLLGISVGCIMTVAITLIGDYFQGSERARFIGFQAAFMSLGGAVCVGVGGFLADKNWSYPFLIYLFSLVVLIGASQWLYEPKFSSNKQRDQHEKSSNFKIVLPVLAVAFMSMVVFYMLTVQLPFALQEIGVANSSSAGLAIAIATLAATAIGFCYGMLRSKLSIELIFILLFVIMGLGFWRISQSSSFNEIVVSMIIVGCGMGLLMPNLNTWLLSNANDSNRGTYSGWLSSSLFLGQFLSPIAVLPIVKIESVSYAFSVGAVMLAILALIFFFKFVITQKPKKL